MNLLARICSANDLNNQDVAKVGIRPIYYDCVHYYSSCSTSILSTIVKDDEGEAVLVSPPSTTNAGFGSIWLAARLPALADKGEFRRVMVHWASYGPNTPCATPAMIHALMYIHTQPTTPADPLL